MTAADSSPATATAAHRRLLTPAPAGVLAEQVYYEGIIRDRLLETVRGGGGGGGGGAAAAVAAAGSSQLDALKLGDTLPTLPALPPAERALFVRKFMGFARPVIRGLCGILISSKGVVITFSPRPTYCQSF